jgi:predicted acetyltransferase
VLSGSRDVGARPGLGNPVVHRAWVAHHERVKIRQINASERDPLSVRIQAYAFGQSPSDDVYERMRANQKFYREHVTVVAEVDGDAVADASAVPMRQNIRGATFRMAGIAGVATLPQARRRGYASALVTELLGMMRESGYPVSTLYPFRPSFYGRHGFVGLPQPKTATFPVSSVAWLRGARLAGTVRWGRLAEHYDAYRALTERLLAGRHGFAVLPESRMEQYRQADNPWLVTAWVDDTVAGAVSYRISGFGRDLVAGDMLTASPLGRALLLGFFGSHADQVEKVSVVVSPAELPELWGTDFAAEISAETSFPTSPAPMARVLSVEGLAGMPVGDARVTVEVVEDPFIAGYYQLDGTTGVLDARRVTAATTDATLTAAGLSGLIYGVLDPDELPIRGFGQVSGPAAERLRTLFPRALPYLHAHF